MLLQICEIMVVSISETWLTLCVYVSVSGGSQEKGNEKQNIAFQANFTI